MSSRVWLISGANAGLGLELSTKAISEGDRVMAAVRNPSRVSDSLKRLEVKVIAFDLAWSQEKINEVFATAYEAFGKIDVVVNMAAFAYMGAIEKTTDEDVKKQYEINIFDVLRVIRACLPHLSGKF